MMQKVIHNRSCAALLRLYKRLAQSLLIPLLLICCLSTPAKSFAATITPIPADQAFQLTATAKDYQTVLITWKVQPGYYLYRDRFHFSPTPPSDAEIGQPLLPEGTIKTTPGIGSYSVYFKNTTITLPIAKSTGGHISLKVCYQGCSASGFCYPPMTKLVTVNLSGNYMVPIKGVNLDVIGKPRQIQGQPQDKISELLQGQSTLTLLLAFFGFGLLVAFTPCILPMVPILSGIILGHKKMTHLHAFLLSLSYVLGMAITYALAGMIFGYLGGSIQTIMQQPWIIFLFSLIFVGLALSLFGFYHLQLPEKVRDKFAHLSEHQKHGTYAGVFLMGCFSTLILSPCVTPPLVAVLGYISQTGNASWGGLALFVMGLGMGTPLLIIGASSTKLLPKAGPWMNTIERFMGVLLLAVAIYMISRIIEPLYTAMMWIALMLGYSIYLGAFSTATDRLTKICKTCGIILFIYALAFTIGTIAGSHNPWNPLAITQKTKPNTEIFQPVKTFSDVFNEMDKPGNKGKPVLLDFYADWCVACKVMDAEVFSNPTVQAKLKGYLLLRADVTANDDDDKTLEQRFEVIAPPTLIIFNHDHTEVRSAKIVGEMTTKAFLKHLDKFKPLIENATP